MPSDGSFQEERAAVAADGTDLFLCNHHHQISKLPLPEPEQPPTLPAEPAAGTPQRWGQ